MISLLLCEQGLIFDNCTVWVSIKSCNVSEIGEGFDLRPSVYGRTTDALASRGDEGRGKLRKAPGSGKLAQIRGCPNGETPHPSWGAIPR